MVRRTDGLPFPAEAQVNRSLCVSCGICVGSCPSSTPFRRTQELKTGIDLPDYPVDAIARADRGDDCRPDRGRSRADLHVRAWRRGRPTGDTVALPCVAMRRRR